jgi:hypothetical protein
MDDVRYIILPGDLRKDDRLTMGHLRIAMVLGAYSKRNGWTDLTQQDVGEMAGLTRQTVCTLVGELVEWGWVARRKKQGKNQYVYRFIMDREDCQLEPTVPEKDCQPQPTGTVGSDPTFITEDSSTLRQSSSVPLPLTPERVQSEVGQDDKFDLEGKGRMAGILRIKPGEGAWTRWVEHIERKLGERHAEAAVAMGELEVTTRWPTDASPMPRIARIAS